MKHRVKFLRWTRAFLTLLALLLGPILPIICPNATFADPDLNPAPNAIGPEPETQCGQFLVKEKSFSFYYRGSCQDLVGKFSLDNLSQGLSQICLKVFGASSAEPLTTWACPDRTWNQKTERYEKLVCMSCNDAKGGPGYCAAEAGTVPLSCRVQHLKDYQSIQPIAGSSDFTNYCVVGAEISGNCRYSCAGF